MTDIQKSTIKAEGTWLSGGAIVVPSADIL